MRVNGVVCSVYISIIKFQLMVESKASVFDNGVVCVVSISILKLRLLVLYLQWLLIELYQRCHFHNQTPVVGSYINTFFFMFARGIIHTLFSTFIIRLQLPCLFHHHYKKENEKKDAAGLSSFGLCCFILSLSSSLFLFFLPLP